RPDFRWWIGHPVPDVGRFVVVGRLLFGVVVRYHQVADSVVQGVAVVVAGLIRRRCVAEQRLGGDEDAQVWADAVDGRQAAGAEDLADDRDEGVGTALIR